jgi:post-segregation antitoxin (ccd killing protein)
MSMVLERRLQVLLDEQRYQRLAEVAQARGVSIATVVREAIDRGLASSQTSRRNAGARILETPPMPVDDLAGLRRELDELRSRRG